MKDAIAEVSGIQLLYKKKLDYIETVYRKGDKNFFGRKNKQDLFIYKKISKFDSLEKLADFLSMAITIDNENNIWAVPQLRINKNTGFMNGSIEIISFNTNNEAEKKFNELVKKYNLNIIKS